MIFSIPDLYKQKRALKVIRRSFRTAARQKSFPTLLALALIISGTFGGYFSLHAATSTRRAPLVFQGRISDANYVPVADGARNMIFRIWDASTGGNCIWITGTGTTDCDSTANSGSFDVAVTITRGIFSVPLGDTSVSGMPALDQDFDNQSSQLYYLSISVETNTSGTYEDLSPRIRISAVPYAYNSDELDGLNSLSFLRSDANTTLTQPVATTGSPSALTVTGGIHTTLTPVEAVDVRFNLAREVQFTGSTTVGASNILAQRAAMFQAPTYSFTSTGAQTITHAATLAILDAPNAGTNATLTNTSALWLSGSSNMTRGRFLKMSYLASTTVAQSGPLFGLDLDLNPTGGITFTAGSNALIGVELNMPIVSGATGATHTAINIDSAGWTSASGTNNWKGLKIDMPDITQTGGTLTSIGLYITGGTVTSGTSYAIATNEAAGKAGLGTLTPDYRLELETAVSTTNSFALSSADVAHGRTSVDQTGTWFSVKSADSGGAGTGGALITGIGEGADGAGLQLRGIFGSTTPNSTLAAVTIFGMKADGGSAFTSIGAAETVFQLINNSTVLWTALGNGNTGFGTATPDTTFDLSGTLSYTPSATQSITGVGSAILANAAYVIVDPDGTYTLTSAPTIADGSTGQILYITTGPAETGAITIQDQSISGVATNVELGAASRTIGDNDVLVLMFNGTDWIEASYSNN